MELDEGDHISLVNYLDVPKKMRQHVRKFRYELCRSAGVDVVLGEILVQTNTKPIIVDSDSDTDVSNMNDKKEQRQSQLKNAQAKKKNSAEMIKENLDDDYEIGEPSGIVQPPPPSPKKTDPVSLVYKFSFFTKHIRNMCWCVVCQRTNEDEFLHYSFEHLNV